MRRGWVERLVVRARRLAEPLGPLSPFATLETFSPAARNLLADAERGAERVLHLVRLVILVAAVAFGVFGFGLGLSWPIVGIPFAIMLALWGLVWRRLGHGRPSLGFRVGLTLFDGLMITRGVLWIHNPGGIVDAIWTTSWRYSVMTQITPEVVEAVTTPMLVFLSLTGAFRLDPRLAAFSTMLSVTIYAYLRWIVPAPALQTYAIGLIIWFAGALGANAARAIRYVALKASHEEVLARYVPSALTTELERSGDPGAAATVDEITVMTVDVRGFTALAARMEPEAAVDFLNRYLEVVVEALESEDAVVDKFMGDGVLAFLQGEGHARQGLRAADAVIAAIDRMNASRDDGAPLSVGVALHSGRALLGTIGTPTRRDYTVIGDVVNIAARLDAQNRQHGWRLCASDTVLQGASCSAEEVGLVGPTPVHLRGRDGAMLVYHR